MEFTFSQWMFIVTISFSLTFGFARSAGVTLKSITQVKQDEDIAGLLMLAIIFFLVTLLMCGLFYNFTQK